MIRKLVIPPELGDIAEVRVLAWHKQDGEGIASGDALVELETDKVIVLVTSQESGFLRRRFAGEGDWIKLSEVAAFVSDSLEDAVPEERSANLEGMMARFETT